MSGSLGPQFIPITELNKMQAGDFDPAYYTSAQVRQRPGINVPTRVGDLSRDHPTYKARPYDWDSLSEDVAKNGLEPLHVGTSRNLFEPDTKDLSKIRVPTLFNGHHRAIVAREQGHMFVPVSENDTEREPPMQYRAPAGGTLAPLPWRPMWREHLAQTSQPTGTMGVHPDQGQLFPREQFTDRRKKKYGR